MIKNIFIRKISNILSNNLSKNGLNLICLRSQSHNSGNPIRIAVIGSGPSGFYITQQLLKVCLKTNIENIFL